MGSYPSLRSSSPVLCFCGSQRGLRDLVDFFSGYALRANTKRTYSTHHRTFERLCTSIGIDADQPISERQLCGVVILYAQGHRITTVSNFVSGVRDYALGRGHPELPRNRLYRAVRSGLDNWFGDTNIPRPKQGITLDNLFRFRTHLDLTLFDDARDWCACLFAFYGLLRVKEYTCGGLRIKDVKPRKWGVSLTVPYSKTTLIPATVDIIRRDDDLCPLRAYSSYHELIPLSHLRPDLPFFFASTSSFSPLLDSSFIRRVRELIQRSSQRDPLTYAGHSFRRGGTTALALAGVPEATIASHGRWKSLAYRGYFDVQHSLRLRLTATAQLSLYNGASL